MNPVEQCGDVYGTECQDEETIRESHNLTCMQITMSIFQDEIVFWIILSIYFKTPYENKLIQFILLNKGKSVTKHHRWFFSCIIIFVHIMLTSCKYLKSVPECLKLYSNSWISGKWIISSDTSIKVLHLSVVPHIPFLHDSWSSTLSVLFRLPPPSHWC